jgi:cellulose synthase/poly-beta-1,6-N-acetylglucosamine synthase-like glycosyltransferase
VIGAALFWGGFLVVVLTYAGYGAWVAWRARVRPRPCRAIRSDDAELPGVTCVIAACNEAGTIGRKLGALFRQDYPPDRLRAIVVSDGSTDATDGIVADWAARDPRVRLLRTPERGGKPTALNLALPHVGDGVAVFMDARQDLTAGALRELVAHLADPDVGVVSGDYRLRGDGYWAYERFVRRCESRSGSLVQVTGSLYALRAGDVRPLPPGTILDDVYVPLRVALSGRRIVMAEDAGSLDAPTRTLGGEFVRKVRTLAGLVQVCHALPGVMSPARNPVWGRFVAHKMLRLLCPYALLGMLAGSLTAPGWAYRAALAAAAVGVLAVAAARSFLMLNLAALWAPAAYYLGRASVTWTRVEGDRR